MSDSKILDLDVATDLTGASFVIAKTGTNEQVLSSNLKNFLNLDEVDNTADLDKPISTATQAALDALVGAITADGDKGDIVISGSGATWTIDSGVLSAFMRTVLDDADAATARATLGLTIGTHVQAYDADLTTWAGLTPSANAQSLVTAANYAAMRALLDLEAGTDFYSIAAADTAFQSKDTDLTAIAALTSAADKIPYSTGAGTWALADFPAAARTAFTAGFSADVLALLDDANFAAMRTSLGLGIGVNVQAYDADLTTWAGITPSANVQSLVSAADYAAMRTLLGLVIGTNVQAYDALLAAIAALTTANGKFLAFTGVDTAAVRDIVGTVSESSGTPTGAIIEKGSNANGEYVRFADGTQLAWGQCTTSGGVDNATGNNFQSDVVVKTLAATFTTQYSFVSANTSETIWCTTGAHTTTTVEVQAKRSTTTATNYTMNVISIGRWY